MEVYRASGAGGQHLSLIHISTRPPEEQNLASCAELVRAANTNGGSNLLTNLMNQLPLDHPARMNYKSIEIAPEKTYGSISVSYTHLDVYKRQGLRLL